MSYIKKTALRSKIKPGPSKLKSEENSVVPEKWRELRKKKKENVTVPPIAVAI